MGRGGRASSESRGDEASIAASSLAHVPVTMTPRRGGSTAGRASVCPDAWPLGPAAQRSRTRADRLHASGVGLGVLRPPRPTPTASLPEPVRPAGALVLVPRARAEHEHLAVERPLSVGGSSLVRSPSTRTLSHLSDRYRAVSAASNGTEWVPGAAPAGRNLGPTAAADRRTLRRNRRRGLPTAAGENRRCVRLRCAAPIPQWPCTSGQTAAQPCRPAQVSITRRREASCKARRLSRPEFVWSLQPSAGTRIAAFRRSSARPNAEPLTYNNRTGAMCISGSRQIPHRN